MQCGVIQTRRQEENKKLHKKWPNTANQTMLTEVPVLHGAGLFFRQLSLLSYGSQGIQHLKVLTYMFRNLTSEEIMPL